MTKSATAGTVWIAISGADGGGALGPATATRVVVVDVARRRSSVSGRIVVDEAVVVVAGSVDGVELATSSSADLDPLVEGAELAPASSVGGAEPVTASVDDRAELETGSSAAAAGESTDAALARRVAL
jgi:hypothetical protein